jgi:hypothetical protein
MSSKRKSVLDVDTVSAGLFLVLFAIWIHYFQYQGVLGEADLYRVMNGIIDGAVTGSRLGSSLHYGKDFSFGYILGLYALAPTDLLRDPDRLIPLINNIGFFFIIAGLFFYWLSTRLVYGSRVATIALVLFAFSPMLLELATSGHQILIAFSLFAAATACLFWQVGGSKAVLPWVAGTILLIAALCVRADIFLALPYIALTRVELRSWRSALRSVGLAAVSPTVALIAFLVLRHYLALAPHHSGGVEFLGQFPHVFGQFYRWSNIVPGFAYFALGCGIVTVLICIGLVARIAIQCLRRHAGNDVRSTLEQIVGPIALIIVPFLFWIPNPQPSRHFLLALAGISILIGWVIGKLLMFRFAAALASVLGIVVTNQALSEGVRPALLRMNAARSPYRPPPEQYDTFNHAPLGLVWRHHATNEARLLRWKELGDKVATSCDANTVIFSDEPEQILSRLYANGASVQSSAGYTDGFLAYSATRGAQHFVFIYKTSNWPRDAVATVLADPNFNGYQMYADPYLPSIYDKTAIPEYRLARFGCTKPRS